MNNGFGLDDLAKLIVPLIVGSIWALSFLFGREGQAPPVRRPMMPPPPPPPRGGSEPFIAFNQRPAMPEPMREVETYRQARRDLDLLTRPPEPARSERPARPPKPPKPPKTKPSRRASESPTARSAATIGGLKIEVPILNSGLASATPSAASAPLPGGRPAPFAVVDVRGALASPERIREALVLSEVMSPPLALRPRRAPGRPG